MKRFRMALFAMFAVALMAVTPLAAMGEGASAAGISMPEPESYLYAITTDSKNVQITSVEASTGGSALSQISGTRTAKEDVPDYWSFDGETGMGPFNSFYAAVNIDDGDYFDSGEAKRNHRAGTVAFVLDPYDLKRSVGGTALTGHYNIMLVVPTVYWKSVGTTLYLSSSPSYTAGQTTVEGMVAYAHTATSGGASKVYPYIGIGVYEASVDVGAEQETRLLSVSGATPKTDVTCDTFKGYADNLTPAAGSDYQQWNFYQWTLYKMMAYTVMGTKNSQEMIGSGNVNGNPDAPSTTGLADAAGPYGATEFYSKMFLENTWGSASEFVGDAAFNSFVLYVRSDLGGTELLDGQGAPNFGSQSSTGVLLSTSNWIGEAYSESAYWDFPKARGGSSSGFSVPGDYVWRANYWRSLLVSGTCGNGSSAGIACVNGSQAFDWTYPNYGARLAYVMDADAVAATPKTIYASNGGAGGDVIRPQVAVAEGCMFGAPWGHAFAGWNTEADGTGVWYSFGDSIDGSGQPVVTLYAQWERITGRIPDPVDYMYVLSTDSNNVSMLGVRASVGGSDLAYVYNWTNTYKGRISSFWGFDRLTGMGPFNSFYAAINLYDGEGPEADGAEFKLNSAAGAIAFVLDPYDLSKTLMGTEFDKSRYNVMLIVPTVYWKAEGNALYLSSSPSYTAGTTTVEGMVAYAHTATSGGDSKVYPHIGIGVYEGYVADGKLTSRSGVAPTNGTTNDGFKARADALIPAEGSAYQQWNFYQWTLYKMMAYTVMGTKNSQEMMGSGNVDMQFLYPSMTGLADAAGPYGATYSYSKLLIENPWGSLYEFVGDALLGDGALYAGNALGGATLDSADVRQTYAGAFLPSNGWISGASGSSETWDLPVSSQSSNNSYSFSAPGDCVWSNSGWRSLYVGGDWGTGSDAGLAYAHGLSSLSISSSSVGARLAYVMDAGAVSAPGDGLIYKVTDSAAGEASVFGTYEDLSDIVIPSTIGTYSVKSIEDHAFSGCENITCVALPGSLGYIGAGAFGECEFYDLEGNRLPVTAEALRGHFYVGENGALRQVADASVGTQATVGGLRYKVVSDSPWAASLVGHEGGIEHLAVPATVFIRGKAMPVVSVGSKAFYGCGTLASVDLGSVAEVGQKAFANCASMTSLQVPDTVERIGPYAFYGCKGLTSLTIPGDGVVLEPSAFSACVRMKSVSFTGTGAVIERNAFYKNNGVAALDLAGVASVGYKAFPYCKGLRTLTVPGTLESLGDYAFYSCASLKTLVVEEGVEAIGASAFSECRALQSITLPGSLESVGRNAFYGVRLYDLGGSLISQKEVFSASGTFVGADGRLWQTASFSDGGLKYTASNGRATVTGPEGATVILKIPDKVEHEGYALDVVAIGDRAFRGRSLLSFADLGGVTTIGDRAFSGCSDLSLVIMHSVERIEDYAFFNCTDIRFIAFSESLSHIGTGALHGVKLYGADGATRLTAAEDLAGMRFEEADGRLRPVLPNVGDELVSGGVRYVLTSSDPLAASAVGFVGEVSSLPSAVAFNGYGVPVTSVADGAFRLCATISALDLSNVVSIGAKAFSGCTGLESVTFSDGLSSVGSSAFYGTLFYDGGSAVPRTASGLAGKSFEGSGGSLHLVTAHFKPIVDQYTVTVVTEGEKGTVDVDKYVVDYGTRLSTAGNILTVAGYGQTVATPSPADQCYTYSFINYTAGDTVIVSDWVVTAHFRPFAISCSVVVEYMCDGTPILNDGVDIRVSSQGERGSTFTYNYLDNSMFDSTIASKYTLLKGYVEQPSMPADQGETVTVTISEDLTVIVFEFDKVGAYVQFHRQSNPVANPVYETPEPCGDAHHATITANDPTDAGKSIKVLITDNVVGYEAQGTFIGAGQSATYDDGHTYSVNQLPKVIKDGLTYDAVEVVISGGLNVHDNISDPLVVWYQLV